MRRLPDLLGVSAAILLATGCATHRPYRVGGPELEKVGMYSPPPASQLPRLPEGRPLVVSLFGWHVANPVGLMVNMDKSHRKEQQPLVATYYGRGVDVTLFESVTDALRARRHLVFRDYLGHTAPGIIPAWARAQRFLVLEGEILRFEHSKIKPPGGVTPPGAQDPDPRWGHEAAYVMVRFRLWDSVNGRTVLDRTIATWTKAVHSDQALAVDAYANLGTQLVELLRRDPAFMAALGGGE